MHVYTYASKEFGGARRGERGLCPVSILGPVLGNPRGYLECGGCNALLLS